MAPVSVPLTRVEVPSALTVYHSTLAPLPPSYQSSTEEINARGFDVEVKLLAANRGSSQNEIGRVVGIAGRDLEPVVAIHHHGVKAGLKFEEGQRFGGDVVGIASRIGPQSRNSRDEIIVQDAPDSGSGLVEVDRFDAEEAVGSLRGGVASRVMDAGSKIAGELGFRQGDGVASGGVELVRSPAHAGFGASADRGAEGG